MADEFPVPCGGRSGKVSDTGVDPPDRIDGVRTVGGDSVADEKILRYILLHPLPEPLLFFNGPPPISHFPELIRGLIEGLTIARSAKEDHQKKKEGKHGSILKRRMFACQQERFRNG
jgi:hypothetical protein